MKLLYILINIFLFYSTHGHDSASPEVNRIEVSPIFDTVVFSDIADVINDFENNFNSPIDAFINSDSESDENIEDLLAEYQHYLDKAHKQRKSYIEKSKKKNKVPLYRHEKYSKIKPSTAQKYDDYYTDTYYNPDSFKFSPPLFNNPLDYFIPFNSKVRYSNKPEYTTTSPKGSNGADTLEKIIYHQKSMNQPLKPSCYCKNDKIPCECSCKQCLIPLELIPEEDKNTFMLENIKNPLFALDEKPNDLQDNTLNVRIKIDVQLPKIQEIFGKYYKSHIREKPFNREDGSSKEFASSVNLPFPFFNFPLPMELFGYTKGSKLSKHDSLPVHKVTIHKKKKSRLNNGNKKHRKKVITFHNIKVDHQIYPTHIEESYNITKNIEQNQHGVNGSTIKADNISTPMPEKHLTTNKAVEILEKKQGEDSFYLTVNISSSDNMHKMENSIETEYKNTAINTTTQMPKSRTKREMPSLGNITYKVEDTEVITNIPKKNKEKINSKKSDKDVLIDAQLLYWPNNSKNHMNIQSKNITTIILEREINKSKLNMSKETILHNHTQALEQAIFGEVDWNDVDTVAPAFMSFVGKYIKGILTFCSQTICHSMKCGNKTCIHRTCIPTDRLNNKGHCAVSTIADSVASMESIMDLPSNIVFEVVDILQDKMLGKLFGKVTLCISSKCVSFAASKKVFQKSKCTCKELNSVGHCPNVKNFKIM